MARRHYSDADRAAALAVYDSTADQVHRLRDAARQFGCPESTLRSWLADRGRAAPAEVRAQKIESLADVFERVAYRAAGLQDVAMAWIEERGGEVAAKHLSDLNRVGGTAVDKTQLLRGQATSRVEVDDKRDPEQVAGRVAEIFDMAKYRKAKAG